MAPSLQACLTTVPSMPQSVPLFWGQNPLKIPLICGFKRLLTRTRITEGGELMPSEVIYKTPCGRRLYNYDEVMSFLLDTESCDILQVINAAGHIPKKVKTASERRQLWCFSTFALLQVDFFTFNPSIHLDPPPSAQRQSPELDLSRGVEPTPVELCLGEGGARPPPFRYRKERWPHGCFLSRSLTLFRSCCDCADGCSDATRCACIAMTAEGRHYSHQRLEEPVPSG